MVFAKLKTWVSAHRRQRIWTPFLILLLGVGVGWLLFHKAGAVSPTDASHAPSESPAETIWTCSMHPQIRQPHPGACPICGMDLIPLSHTPDSSDPKTVVMSERAAVLARIGTTKVQRQRTAGTDLHLLGRIEPNETAVKNITAWTGGRIDRLHVKVTGQKVKSGQIVATLYSPEVFSAHQDLLVAKKQVEKMQQSSEAGRNAAQRALDATRTRLRLLGVLPDVLSKMEEQSEPTTRVAVRSPFAGTVTERVATEGAYVSTGALLYRIVDLSSVWVQLDAYEGDLPSLHVGQSVDIQVEGLSKDTFTGNITFIDPTLDATRRVARVRVEVKNKDGRLRPGMFVQAEVKSPLQKDARPPLVIPETAPLFTGRRAVVFVEDVVAARPTYTARTVRLGLKSGHEYPVIAGLSEGERVVTKGAFTLDADLQIHGGDSMMTAPDDLQTPEADPILPLLRKEREKLAPVFLAYLEMQKELAADALDRAQAANAILKRAAAETHLHGSEAVTRFWTEQRKQLLAHAARFAAAEGIEDARGVFEPLSNQMIELLERMGNPLDSTLRLTFCPMAFGSKGAFWIQTAEVVDNPYYGNAMRTCGEIRQPIDAGTYLVREHPVSTPPDAPLQAIPAGGHSH